MIKLCQVVLPRPEHVISDINPFFLVAGSATTCPVAGAAEAIAVLLDFFPILLESITSEEFCTVVEISVTQRIGCENQIRVRYIDQCTMKD